MIHHQLSMWSIKNLLFPQEKPWEGTSTTGIHIFLLIIIYIAMYINTYAGIYH